MTEDSPERQDLTAPLMSQESQSREPAGPQLPGQESLPLLPYTGSWGAAPPPRCLTDSSRQELSPRQELLRMISHSGTRWGTGTRQRSTPDTRALGRRCPWRSGHAGGQRRLLGRARGRTPGGRCPRRARAWARGRALGKRRGAGAGQGPGGPSAPPGNGAAPPRPQAHGARSVPFRSGGSPGRAAPHPAAAAAPRLAAASGPTPHGAGADGAAMAAPRGPARSLPGASPPHTRGRCGAARSGRGGRAAAG